MGQAKRRKQLDPDYGKPVEELPAEKLKAKAESWYQEAQRSLSRNYLPDYGHFYFANMGLKPINLFFSGQFMIVKERAGLMIIVQTQEFLISVTITDYQFEQQIKPHLNLDDPYDLPNLEIKAVPNPSDRYQTSKKEWVLPLKALTIRVFS